MLEDRGMIGFDLWSLFPILLSKSNCDSIIKNAYLCKVQLLYLNFQQIEDRKLLLILFRWVLHIRDSRSVLTGVQGVITQKSNHFNDV